MLGLLALVVVMAALATGPTEGLVLTKCELKAELEAMLPDMDDDEAMKMPFKMEDILAKIICKIEHTTQFNTSVVTVLEPPKPLFPFKPLPGMKLGGLGKLGKLGKLGRPGAGDEGSGSGSGAEGEMEPMSPARPPWGRPFGRPWSPPRRGKRAALGRFPPMRNPFSGRPWGKQESEEESEEEDPEVVEEEVEQEADSWTLYGLFQLAGRVVCESEDTPSLNICQMPCSDLIDDDISDDIDCLKELKRSHQKMKLDPVQNFRALAMKVKMMKMMFPPQCFFLLASDYFAECK